MTIPERILRIEDACASPLGFSQRGVTSWERDLLIDWRGKLSLLPMEMAKLMEIETQVFGYASYTA